MDDEVLIHITGWRDLLRYATHERNASWSPPLFSLEAATTRDLVWRLSPLEFAVYHALIAEYAAAPVLPGMVPTGAKVKGSDGVPRRLPLQRAIHALMSAGWGGNKRGTGRIVRALDSLIDAGLLALSTVDGRSVDSPVVVMGKGWLGHGHGQGSNGSPPDLRDLPGGER